jgi:formylglycine-generating enzyme required for sulfatase activity
MTSSPAWCFLAMVLLKPGVAISAHEAPPGMAMISEGVFRPLFTVEREPKQVPVRAFWLDRMPVKVGEFLEFVRLNPTWRRSQAKPIFADESYLSNWAADLEPGTNAPLTSPITFVSWFAAKAYADWQGKRLPTVAEWEYAASAGFTNPDGAKDQAFQAEIQRWYSTPSPARLPSTGAGRPNVWGVYNLHGLVWEWTLDFNSAMQTGDARDDSSPDRQLFCGAGSQGAREVKNFPAFMRYGFRSSLKANYCVHNLGFRCAKDL